MPNYAEEKTFVNERLNDIIAAYLEAADAGWAPDRAAFLSRYPDLGFELARYFANEERIAGLTGSHLSPRPSWSPSEPTKSAGGDTPVPSELPTTPQNGGPSLDLLTGISRGFGDYELIEEISRGGMGIVYRARQKSLNRTVALKMILAGQLARPSDVQRFRREAEAAANLDHPNIVPIYEVNEHAGRHYYSMKLIEGGNLSQHMPHLTKEPRAGVQVLATVARAVHHAHQRGILHRDLKPANILIDSRGQPHVADFGLAKRLAVDAASAAADTGEPAPSPSPGLPAELTASPATVSYPNDQTDYEIAGTPSYMAPEQAAGRKGATTTAADVYSLGAILYKLLTGRPPFKGKTSLETIRLVREQQLPPPRSVKPNADVRLEAICLKCMARRPLDRYVSAQTWAEDLERWLQGEPPLVWPQPWPLRTWRAARKHVALVTAAAVLGFAAGLLFLVSYYSDPDRPLKDIEAKLTAGKKVTLVGASGRPAWFRWNTGEDDVGLSTDLKKPLTINTFAAGRMKLLNDPLLERYRFAAEVRHEDAKASGNVGLYFGYGTKPLEAGVDHYWCELSFADRGLPNPASKAGAPREPAQVMLFAYHLTEPAHALQVLSTSVSKHFPDVPPDAQESPWRSLAVEVTPDTVEAFWDGKSIGSLGTIIQPNETSSLLNMVAPKKEKLMYQFAPRGTLGLYVFSGKASFRNVVIEPLP